MNNAVIDDSKVMNLFQALDQDSRKAILFKALKEGSNKLAEQTKQQLRSKIGSAASSPNWWDGKPLDGGIRVNAEKDYCEVNVNIMGDFRLKFFERGTKFRQTKKGYNRGSMKPIYFFKSARANESDITSVINYSIEESLKRISN